MNGGQDLGGMMGFGPVAPETNEPIFHAAWERRAFGLALAMGATGSWTLDASRHARESLPPAEYLTSSYYEIWIKGLTKLLLARRLVSIHELYGDQPIEPGPPLKRVVRAQDVPELLASGTSYLRAGDAPARFEAGDAVLVRNDHKTTHTRAPRYVRGRRGRIVRANGVFVYPDTNAHDGGENPQWCYTVRFTGPELWGEGADPTLVVMADLWESYLERP
jgi:nitrile hydratase subunit beta